MKKLLLRSVADIAKNSWLQPIHLLSSQFVQFLSSAIGWRNLLRIEPRSKVLHQGGSHVQGVVEVGGNKMCQVDDQLLQHGKIGDDVLEGAVVGHFVSPSEMFAAYERHAATDMQAKICVARGPS